MLTKSIAYIKFRIYTPFMRIDTDKNKALNTSRRTSQVPLPV